jgi:DNA repair exonuclease SbcCD ATPase subunit
MLEKENRALKTELAEARAKLADLQAQIKESQEIENRLREQSRTQTEELARLKEARADAPSSQEFQAMERRCTEMEAGRQALESKLHAALVVKAELERQLQALRDVSAAEKVSVNSREALQKEIQRLEQLNAKSEQERRLAEAQTQELEQQVAELSAVVQEFVDRQAPADGDELESLNAELETVRAQAAGDVMAVQAKLRGAEQEVARLKGALEAAQEQLLRLDADRQAGLKTGRQGAGFGRALFGKIVYSLLMAAIGAALLIAVTAGTAAGRELTQKLLASFE